MYAYPIKKWKEKLDMPANENLGEVLVWLDSIKIGSSSYLLEAFKIALLSEAEGIYLVTDKWITLMSTY